MILYLTINIVEHELFFETKRKMYRIYVFIRENIGHDVRYLSINNYIIFFRFSLGLSVRLPKEPNEYFCSHIRHHASCDTICFRLNYIDFVYLLFSFPVFALCLSLCPEFPGRGQKLELLTEVGNKRTIKHTFVYKNIFWR